MDAKRRSAVELYREAKAAAPYVEHALAEEREATVRQMENMARPDTEALQDAQRYLRALRRIRFRMERDIHGGEAALREDTNG